MMLIAEVIFIIQCGYRHRQTDIVQDSTYHPVPQIGG